MAFNAWSSVKINRILGLSAAAAEKAERLMPAADTAIRFAFMCFSVTETVLNRIRRNHSARLPVCQSESLIRRASKRYNFNRNVADQKIFQQQKTRRIVGDENFAQSLFGRQPQFFNIINDVFGAVNDTDAGHIGGNQGFENGIVGAAENQCIDAGFGNIFDGFADDGFGNRPRQHRFFNQRNKERARLLIDADGRINGFDGGHVGFAVDRSVSAENADFFVFCQGDGVLRARLDHPQYGNPQIVFERRQRIRRDGVAGDNEGGNAVSVFQKAAAFKAVFNDGFRRPVAVGNAGNVAEVD